MKKLLGLFMVLALAIPASADVLKNVDVKGEIQTIASDVHHNALAGAPAAPIYKSGTSARVLAGLSAELVEDVTANLLFQYANVWGNDDSAGKTVNGYWNSIRLVEGNVVLSNLLDCFEATIGRQFYGEEDSAVMYIGPNHYNAEFNGATRSLDAAKVTYSDDVKAFTMLAGTINNTFDTPAAVPAVLVTTKSDIFGADFKLKLAETLTAQVYGYDVRNNAVNEDKNIGFYGGKLVFNPQAAKLAVEYARNFGGHRLIKEGDNTGYMVKVDGAATVEAMTLRGTFLYEHENFWAYGNYTPGLLIGHRLGGAIGDYSAAEGVRLFNVGVDVKPFEKWTFSLDGYSFQDRFGHHSSTWEGDLTVKYTHNEYVQLFAGAGYAKYGTDEPVAGVSYKNALHKDNYKGQLGMLINF